MGQFSDWLRRGKNYREGENVEYYEDTHDDKGEYKKPPLNFSQPNYSAAPPYTPQPNSSPLYSGSVGPQPLPNANQYVSPRLYQNMVVYRPRTPEDVQMLIDFLKRREPAIINLNDVSSQPIAQRILDFASGAIYALNGSVHRVENNVFVLSPEGVEITIPYDPQ